MSLRRTPAPSTKVPATPVDFHNSPFVLALRRQNAVEGLVLGAPKSLTTDEQNPNPCDKIMWQAMQWLSNQSMTGTEDEKFLAYWTKVLELAGGCNDTKTMETAKSRIRDIKNGNGQ